jgi:hypothetical protein
MALRFMVPCPEHHSWRHSHYQFHTSPGRLMAIERIDRWNLHTVFCQDCSEYFPQTI